jgi:large subunit ribosomal protein L9
MSTKIILTSEVENLGAEGDVVAVKDGYARNFLVPRGFAIPATTSNLRRVETLRKQREAVLAARKVDAEATAAKLAKLTVSVKAPVGADGKLFGSVTAADIAANLSGQGVEVDKKKIVLAHPLREVGTFEVEVKLHPEVQAKLSVEVVAGARADGNPVEEDLPKPAKKKPAKQAKAKE